MNGLELQDILLTFPEGGRRRTVLDIPYLKVTSGEHIGIRGASGSGKSSLLNVVSGLVLPDRGTVRWDATVPGALPEHERDRWRGQHIGFVFQDFQLFPELEALENVLLPASFTGWRIPEALIRRGLAQLEQMHVCPTRKVRALSRGEKQRVAIAGVIAMRPRCIVLDEPTAMLDPVGRKEVMDTVKQLNRRAGVTVVLITHHMDEAAQADRLVVMAGGHVVADGTPKEVFADVEGLKAVGLTVPETVELCYELRQEGLALPLDALSDEECAQALYRLLEKEGANPPC